MDLLPQPEKTYVSPNSGGGPPYTDLFTGPRQREAVALRYYQGLTDQQVAEAMGISPGSVKTHLHRAVSALAHDLEAFR